MAAGDVSGALIEAQPAANAVSLAVPTPKVGTELLGEPTLTLTYSGTAANPDGRVYAQIVDNASHLVLGNQVTPIPVTLDSASHTLVVPLEAVAADVTAGKTYTLQITDGTSVYFAARQPGVINFSAIKLSVPTVAPGAAQVIPASQVIPPKPKPGCPLATGRLAGSSLGPVTLGMTRKRARKAMRFSSTHGRRWVDYFCLTPIGVRVGYASPALLRPFSAGVRHRLGGRAALVLTSNRFYGLSGVRPGAKIASVKRHLRVGRAYRVGANTWYVLSGRRANGILKVRHGVVQEIGIATRTISGTRAQRLRFLRGFSALGAG